METTMYLDNIKGGDYELTVTDNIGCQFVQHFLLIMNLMIAKSEFPVV